MDRRDFIKMCSWAGLGVASSQLPGTYTDADAAVDGATGWFFFNATGGWDIYRVADAKGDAPNSDGVVINDDFPASAIQSVAGTDIFFPPVGNNDVFFNTLGSMMTVINGINCETNGHDTGQQNTFSGRLQQNSPCLAALIASAYGGTKPLSFITNGGYDSTFGVPISKARLGNTNQLQRLIYTNELSPGQPDTAHYHTQETFERIMAYRQKRLDEMQRVQQLPLIKKKMNLLYSARTGMGDLKKIDDYLPDGNTLNQLSNIERQVEIALAAFKAGLCQTATLTRGGFDTHGNNNLQQDANRSDLFQGVLHFVQRAADHGVSDRVMIVVASDFGRTASYNEAQGKDHSSVGSMLLIDPSGQVPGGRVIGGTDEFGNYEKVDGSGAVGGNITIKNSTIHRWMRKHAGIEDNEVVKLFPLSAGEDVVEFA